MVSNWSEFLLFGRAPAFEITERGRAITAIFLPEKGKKDFRSIPRMFVFY